MDVKKLICHFCHERCGLLADVEEGRVVKVRGNPDHPLSRGHICVKGAAAPEFLYHPDRLNYPLKRVGERGEGKWQRIGWDQALDEIVNRLRQIKEEYGAEALVCGEGTDWTGLQNIRQAFLNNFGSPNTIGHGTVCYCNTAAIHMTTYGWFPFFTQSPYEENPEGMSKCLVVWGGNYANSFPGFYKAIVALVKKGTKLIVVDPRRSELAKKADLWLPLRPATDAALALGMLNVIINENLYDKKFVEKWCYGFDKLKERVQKYPPEKVAEITWVPKDKIIEAARMYGLNKPGVITWGVAIDQIGKNSTQAVRSTCILRAVTGNLDVPGGEGMGRSGDLNKIVWCSDLEHPEKLPPEQRNKQLGTDRFKLHSFPGWELRSEPYQKVYGHLPPLYPTCMANLIYAWDAVLTDKPYPVKAVILQAHNALVGGPNVGKIYKALKTVDFFVAMDYWMTPTVTLADYALPAADWLERPTSTWGGTGDSGNFIAFGEKAVEPLFERKTDYEFWRGLAVRFGYEWPWGESLEDLYDFRLKPINMTFRDLVKRYAIFGPPEYRKYEKTGFATPTGKVELYSTIMEKLGYDPLPSFEEPGESPVSTPELAKDYPLILVTGLRFIHMQHSQHRQIRSLRKRHPDPLVLIHPETASRVDIDEGDWVYIETVRGRCRMRAKLTDDAHPKVITTEHGWWFPEELGKDPDLFGVWKSNNSMLTSDELEHCDQACGGWYNRGLLCKIYKAMD